MKKTVQLGLMTTLLCVILSAFCGQTILAEGDMGIFGGISEGQNLPKTIEKYVTSPIKAPTSFQYKEVVFISGVPTEVSGTIVVTKDESKILKTTTGNYVEKYVVKATNADKTVVLDRSVQFTTLYRVKDGDFKKQIIRESELTAWTEVINVSGVVYTLNKTNSSFSKTGVEDLTPGVSYTSTSISYKAQYTSSNNETINVTGTGAIYGYKQPWSTIETQNLNVSIVGPKLQMDVNIRPIFEAKKTIYYDENEPFPISFGGTYNQRLEREATLRYDIKTYHPTLTAAQLSNSIMITTANEIEKLPIPENLDFVQGHWSEADFKKLYSMEIFTELPHKGMQVEAISRGEYTKALCLAMNIDTSAYEKPTGTSPVIFGDVSITHPDYKYIMAAYDAKLVRGTGQDYDVDQPITRQEAFVIYVRVIGLERLGVTSSPLTPFVDDAKIASWAKKEIMAGYKLGIIKGDAAGKVLPTQWISKAEAAAIINRLIDYLRTEIGEAYTK